MRISIPPDGSVRTGMKAFDRVFSVSAPTTLHGRIRADAEVNVRFSLQRRRIDEPFEDELENGPTLVVGGLRLGEGGWREFSISFDQPRLLTRGVRLLIDAHDAGGNGAAVQFDDLAWIEWRTPWLTGGGDLEQAEFGSHVQFRRSL